MELFKTGDWNLKADKIAFQSTEKNAAKKVKKEQRKKKIKERKDAQIKQAQEEDSEESFSDDEIETIPVVTEQKVTKKKQPVATKPAIALQAKRKLTPLQQKMMAKLSGSRFRWINEQLYTISSEDALELIKSQPELFDEYHDGFRSQVLTWPENPIDVFIDQIQTRLKRNINAPGGLPGLPHSRKLIIADMGCGEATLALKVNNFFKQNKRLKKKIEYKVHSFDLKRVNERITVADIKNVPLPDESCSIVVFCLALMGTNFLDFIKEAYRILTPRGEIWIAEIKSRFADGKGDEFVNALKLLGFFHKNTDDSNKMFTRFEFFKPPEDILKERIAKLERRQKFIEVQTEKEQLETKRKKAAEGKWLLKPCIYKRR
ncbi:25S rRNA (adenine645-N1)-methyltransferase KNAG_0H02890 [Huiozyma naganishii CBS 8797]|uniref:Ribosomal RNA-processing protein 8 n=1 Tax=Huiozyma naganishii (strain ATCC MYA-139 / BCRC 22969 / CBS 8797 / KCTC 17520 / NBRC 10181 / NCYC 3082 / Yp74L-3) TaxID=1071383 RepID=J7S8R7_HUIN7|nr:hypothetical protein KNAG_0H02890 [Kazachstania naganishii CBS 8797]CCK71704.1 hypothetical protein KNAG_0H02890 [Kazachstania naganishii CBS 8797]